MKLEDVDFEMVLGNRKMRLSEMDDEQIKQVEGIARLILKEKLFACKIKAILCAFQIYLESIVETDSWIEDGNKHH